jgi:hypothetical protein
MVVLLFETGARVSELMSLTLGDWNRRGLKDTAWARNKGSRKRRAKYVRFSEQTVKLLKKYFDLERKAVDVHHYTLDDYLRLAERHEIDLDAVPLFLSQRGTPWTVASFRAHYWKKACAAAKLDADIHQCRHWYVTQSLIEIHEQARKGELTVERGKEELIAYMRLPCRRSNLKRRGSASRNRPRFNHLLQGNSSQCRQRSKHRIVRLFMHFSLAQEGTPMNSSPIFSPQTDPWKKLEGHCAPLVLCAPKTWRDPLSCAQMSVPQNLQGVVGYVLKNLVGCPWNNHLVLLVAVLYSQNIQYRTIEN